MLQKIKEKILSLLGSFITNETFKAYPDIENYYLSQIRIAIFIVFLSLLSLIITRDWKLSVILIAFLIYLSLRPLSYFRQIKNNQIMIYEGIITEIYDNSNEKGIKGNLSQSYKRKYIKMICNGLIFTVYLNAIKDMKVGDPVRLYCNPEYAIEKSENQFIINDYLICYKLQSNQQ